VSERVPAPEGIVDIERNFLPTRALLLSVRDTLCPSRRLALTDALGSARQTLARGRPLDETAAAVFGVMWECVSCLELAANITAPWVDRKMGYLPHGRWAEMTFYDPFRANRFYESSHNWTDERFANVSGHRFDEPPGTSILDVLKAGGLQDDRFDRLFAEAEAATTHRMRKQFEYLASRWPMLRIYGAAYEHGLLLVPSAHAEAVAADGTVAPEALMAWETRKDGVLHTEHATPREVLTWAHGAGELAVALADYVADTRLNLSESVGFDDQGPYLRPLRNVIPYWVDDGDLPEETMKLLDNMSVNWVRTPPADARIDSE
jgi:hypothetical protein